jgi:hypothetical protein
MGYESQDNGPVGRYPLGRHTETLQQGERRLGSQLTASCRAKVPKAKPSERNLLVRAVIGAYSPQRS